MLLNTPICDFNWRAPDFTLADFDGNSHTLSEHLNRANTQGILVAFICNHCPYVKAIITQMVADFAALQAAHIQVLAVMPNDYQHYHADAPDNMRVFAAQHHFSFPYLVDEDQSVARAYDAVCTPDFFGFNKHRELQYRGRLDDTTVSKADRNANSSTDLLDAMLQVAQTQQGPAQQIASMGCSIKWRS